jgi:hypothetical protein
MPSLRALTSALLYRLGRRHGIRRRLCYLWAADRSHPSFNLFGILVVYGIPRLREKPVWGAQRLADAGVKQELYAAAYLLGRFFFISAWYSHDSKYMGHQGSGKDAAFR